MMSEKRFTIGRESNFREKWYTISCDIKDGDEFIFIGMPKESAKFVVDKLNEQQTTINQLNLAIDDLLSHTSCDEIKKENEQLRKENKELQRKLRITSAHLLSDECALTDGQLRKIMKELDGDKE